MTNLQVAAIDAARLAEMRQHCADEHGNPWKPFLAQGWEPLRCCLRKAGQGESIVLISYQPMSGPSPWAEVGPVYVHDEPCDGYVLADRLPAELVGSPRSRNASPSRYAGAVSRSRPTPLPAGDVRPCGRRGQQEHD